MQEVVPVKKRIRYRTVGVESVNAQELAQKFTAGRCIVAIDVAKEAMVAGLADERGNCEALVRFSHPKQTLAFVTLLVALRELGLEVEVAMEPTGVYGESLRYQLEKRDLRVYRVDPTRAHAMMGVLDGVPSQHDAKSCTLIAFLHARGISSLWKRKSAEERALRALVDEYGLYQRSFEQARGHLEALVGEYFPELAEHIHSSCAWHLHLLQAYPNPARMAAEPEAVAALLRRVTRHRLGAGRIDTILTLAESSIGVPMVEGEGQRVAALATTMLYLREQMQSVERRIRDAVKQRPELEALVEMLGPVTVAAMVSDLGSPAAYGSSAAFEKALGLNLKEKSSGEKNGQLHITKRGSSRARRYLFLAALRLIQWDPVVRAWYQARRAYQAGLKLKAVVAVMRKLARAIVHVARGQRFDARKLFDARRLEPIPTETPRRFARRIEDPVTEPSAADSTRPSLAST